MTAALSPQLLSTDQAAELLGVRPGTLETWRCCGRYDLRFVRVGRCIRYQLADVERFIKSNTVHAGDDDN